MTQSRRSSNKPLLGLFTLNPMRKKSCKKTSPAVIVLSLVAPITMFVSNQAWSCDGRMADAPPELTEFFDWCSAEDTLMDPLIVRGAEVVPYVLDVIRDPTMPKRRYAIGALGNIGSDEALPVLQGILQNQDEQDYIRCTALNAIAQIDWELGRSFADRFIVDSAAPLSDVPKCLVRVSNSILVRSKEQWLAESGVVRDLEDAQRRKHN